eukprot:scaffold1976_cov187-Alexandrium_tamarense.AAC.16
MAVARVWMPEGVKALVVDTAMQQRMRRALEMALREIMVTSVLCCELVGLTQTQQPRHGVFSVIRHDALTYSASN